MAGGQAIAGPSKPPAGFVITTAVANHHQLAGKVKVGDLLASINGNAVYDLDSVMEALSAPGKHHFTVLSKSQREVAATKVASAYSASAYQKGRYADRYGERYGELEVHYIEPMIVSEEDEYSYRMTLQDVWTPLELVVENEEAKKAKAKVQRSAPVKQDAPAVKKEKQKTQRSAPVPKVEPKVEVKIVEKIVEVEKYVEVEVLVEKIVYKDVIKYVDVVVEREVQVPVEVERRVEVPVPYEKIVHVEVPVERITYREVPMPVYGEEKVIVKEVTVPVEVVREVTVPVEHVVTKEVHVPVEIGMRSETRVGESRMIIGEETRPSYSMTSEHVRSAYNYTGPTSVGNVSGISGHGTTSSGTGYNDLRSGMEHSASRSMPVISGH